MTTKLNIESKLKIKSIMPIFILSILLIPFVSSAGAGGGSYTPTKPSCTEDTWSCTSWSKCQKDSLQTRTCTLTYDCPDTSTSKPVETASCKYVSELLSSLKCHNLDTLKQRVECRLSLSSADLTKELNVAYLPEECRALSNDAEKEDCVLLYSKSQQCWTLPIGEQRKNCLKQILSIKEIKEQKRQCTNPSCFGALKRNVYALIKFSFYDLEERAQELYEKGLISKEQAVDIISGLEEQKIAFNQASSKEQRKQVILETKTIWNDFIKKLKS